MFAVNETNKPRRKLHFTFPFQLLLKRQPAVWLAGFLLSQYCFIKSLTLTWIALNYFPPIDPVSGHEQLNPFHHYPQATDHNEPLEHALLSFNLPLH